MDIPGFFRDPTTNRYYRVAPGRPPPSREVEKRKREVELQDDPFNHILSGLKFRGQQIKNFHAVRALAMRSEGRCVVRNWQNELLRRTVRRLGSPEYFVFDNAQASDSGSLLCRAVSVADDGFIGAWSGTMQGNPLIKKVWFEEATNKKVFQMMDSEYITSMAPCRVYDITSAKQADGSQIVAFAGYAGCGENFYECLQTRIISETTVTVVRRHKVRDNLRCLVLKENLLALGTENQIIIQDLRGSYDFRERQQNVLSLGFAPYGRVLYAGVGMGRLTRLDCRARSCVLLSTLGVVIKSIKSLNDGNSLVLSCLGDPILLFDVRMNKSVISYAGHVNRSENIPPSFSEGHDLLCSHGQDEQIRFWRMSTGEPIYRMPSPGSGQKFCFLDGNSKKINVYVFNLNRVYYHRLRDI